MKKHYHISQYEAWYLFSFNTPATIIGFHNPMLGLLKEDMFPFVQEASLSLMDKGLIVVDQKNQIKPDADVQSLVSILTSPNHTILVGQRVSGKQKESVLSFNFLDHKVVLLEELPDDSYNLMEVQTKSELLSLITSPFSDKLFWAPDTEHLEASQNLIVEIQEFLQAHEIDKARQCFEKIEGDHECKKHFWTALESPQIRFSIIGFMDRIDSKEGRVVGFSIITDDHYVWLVEITDEQQNITRISKITIKNLKDRIASMLPLSLS